MKSKEIRHNFVVNRYAQRATWIVLVLYTGALIGFHSRAEEISPLAIITDFAFASFGIWMLFQEFSFNIIRNTFQIVIDPNDPKNTKIVDSDGNEVKASTGESEEVTV